MTEVNYWVDIFQLKDHYARFYWLMILVDTFAINSLFFKLRQILPKYHDVARQCVPLLQGCQCQVRRKQMEDVSLTSLGEGEGTKIEGWN